MVRTLPHNIEAEQSVIGSIFLDNRVINTVADQLDVNDFFFEKHKKIYSVIIELFNQDKDIDTTTIVDELKKRDQIDITGGIKYMVELSEIVPTTANIESYIRIVREKSLLRKLIDTTGKIMDESVDPDMTVEEIISNAERQIIEVSRSQRTVEFKKISNVASDVLRSIEHMAKSQGEITGLRTDYYDFDRLTLGLQSDDLFIIAARPAMGKTAFVLNLARNVAKANNCKVAIFSLEMSAEQLVNRMLSAEAKVDGQKIKKGKLDDEEWTRLIAAQHELTRLPIYIDDTPGIKVTEVRAKCRHLETEGNLGLVIIDYLQLLSASKPVGSRQEEVADISRTLKEIAREMHIPVIACAQLSRQVERREDKKPVMSDLRESGSIEQDADIVSFLYRDEYYNPETTDKPNIVDIIFAKHRHGPTGEIELLFIKEYGAMENLQNKNINKKVSENKTTTKIDIDI